MQPFVSNDPRLIAFLKQKSHKLIFINKMMIHEQRIVLFSQLNETSVCKYYWREPQFCVPTRQVTESKEKKKVKSSPVSCWDDS